MSLLGIDVQGILRDLVMSSSLIIAANTERTGELVPCDGYTVLYGAVTASHAGTLYVEQANDETGASFPIVDPFAVSAGGSVPVEVELVCPFVRARYVNGATQQTSFGLDLWMLPV